MSINNRRKNRHSNSARIKIKSTYQQLKAIYKKLQLDPLPHTCLDECIKQLYQAKTDLTLAMANTVQNEKDTENQKEVKKIKKVGYPRISKTKQKTT